MTTAEVQEFARVSRTTVVRWRENGKLPTIKHGKVVRFRRSDVEALLSPAPPSDEAAAS